MRRRLRVGIHIAFYAEKARADERTRSGRSGQGSPTIRAGMRPADRAVLRAVDELHALPDLADGTGTACRAAGADGALDLLLLCGWYHAISFTVRSLRLPLEPGTAPIPSPSAG